MHIISQSACTLTSGKSCSARSNRRHSTFLACTFIVWLCVLHELRTHSAVPKINILSLLMLTPRFPLPCESTARNDVKISSHSLGMCSTFFAASFSCHTVHVKCRLHLWAIIKDKVLFWGLHIQYDNITCIVNIAQSMQRGLRTEKRTRQRRVWERMCCRRTDTVPKIKPKKTIACAARRAQQMPRKKSKCSGKVFIIY